MQSEHSVISLSNQVLTDSVSHRPWLVMVWVLSLAPILPIVSTPRVFDAHFSNFVSAGFRHQGIVTWFFDRLSTYCIMLVSCILIVSCGRKSHVISKYARQLLFIVNLYALVLITVTCIVSKIKFTVGMLGLPIVFTATYFLPIISIDKIVKFIRIALSTIYVYGSIFAIILAPKWAIESGYSTELSYNVNRIYGVAVHANSLAAYLFLFLVLAWVPGARLKFEKLHSSLAILLMFGAQSKTIILIYMIVIVLKMSINRILESEYKKITSVLLFFSLIIILFLFFGSILENKPLLEKLQYSDAVTLTGRFMLWLITFKLWQDKPWFGYGADMWSSEMQLEYAPLLGGWLAPHAHNQFLQTLGEAGIVGLSLLVLVYFVYGKSSIRVCSYTGRVSCYLFIYLLLRSITEVPIVLSASQSNFFNLWVVYAILVASLKYVCFKSDSTESSLLK